MSNKKQFNVYLPPELIRAIKHAAVDSGHSLSDFVEIALQNYLKFLEKQIDESEDKSS